MRIYFAGPLFSAAERDWNVALASALRAAGHEVFLPQEQGLGMDAARIIFANDVAGIDRADCLVAIMDGADPDSGTCWEVGYAYRKKPIVLVRTDMRGTGSGSSGYNAMLMEAATFRIEAIAATIDRVACEVLDALARIEARRDAPLGESGVSDDYLG